VFPTQSGPDVSFKRFILCFGLQSVQQHSHLRIPVFRVVYQLCGCQRDTAVWILGHVRIVVHPNHFIHDFVVIDICSQRIFILKQQSGRTRMQHDDLARLLYIGLIYKPAVSRPDLYGFDILVSGQYPLQDTGGIIVSVIKIRSSATNQRRYVVYLVELFFQKRPFGTVQLDPSACLQAFVRLGGPARPQFHKIGGHVGKIEKDPVANAVPCTQQYNQHKNPPGHGKSCQKRTQFVFSECAENFLKIIKHDCKVY